MFLCDDGHEEICYESRKCPLCAVAVEIDAYQREIEELRDRVQELENDIDTTNL
jgi:hypothetical protein